MFIIPAFELGLWNAWILILLHQVGTSVILQLMYRGVWKDVWDVWKRASNDISSDKTVKRLEYILYVVYFALFGYSIFLPLKLDTIWFLVGLFIYLLGVAFDFMASVSWATSPLDKPIAGGVYRISRNPMDFGNFLVIIGLGIVCISWVFLLLGVVGITLMNMKVVSEERFCLKKYGDEYREYLDRTPRWIGLPKSRKK